MTLQAFAYYALFLAIVVMVVKPVGIYMFRVFNGASTSLDPLLCPVERCFYRLCGIDPQYEMTWIEYALSFVVFGIAGTIFLFLILLLQPVFPWHDSRYLTTPMTLDLALNTAVSFSTTTTWQAYAGETTMSYFSQIVGLVAQNFLAGAAGLAVGIAFIRGLVREQATGLGNFWVDVTRATLRVLLPLSIVGGILLLWQGVPMNFSPYTTVTTLEGQSQVIAQGPVAALETIKNLGTNGGGFFNANSAHPYENPTTLTNLLEMLMIAVLPASLTYTFGRMAKNQRQGWTLFVVMTLLFVVGLVATHCAEQTGNPRLTALGADPATTIQQPGGNMEGKEVRFGIAGSVLTAVTTSNGATGSYNSMHDSYTPLGGMIPLVNMVLGELIYGGLGSGIYSIIIFVLISVFIGGLMVRRSPEYLGKQVSIAEIKLIGLYTFIGSGTILILTALAVSVQPGLESLITNKEAHGFTEILFAYSSSFANNGQNFAGLNGNTLFYNLTTALAMLIGRFGLGILALDLAGYFVRQRRKPASSGTLGTDSLTFAIMLIAVIIIIGALSFFPALALGPIIEHLVLTS